MQVSALIEIEAILMIRMSRPAYMYVVSTHGTQEIDI